MDVGVSVVHLSEKLVPVVPLSLCVTTTHVKELAALQIPKPNAFRITVAVATHSSLMTTTILWTV